MTDFAPLGGLPEPDLVGMLRRGTLWGMGAARFMAYTLVDRLRGRRSDDQKGRRLREMFEWVGGTAVKVGQQLAARSDMLPHPVCEQLARLTDDVPPMSIEEAMRQIEEGLGRPVAEVFEEIDPKPIGAASVACVYRGRLLGGKDVAIKVRRPGIAMLFSLDLTAFNMMTRFMEWSTVARDGTFAHLRDDLKIMFGEEMDFRLESRYQRLFRKAARRAGLRWVSVPKVYADLCSRTVLVSELVTAISARSLLEAVESGDPRAMDRFTEQNIDPALVAHRVMLFSLWVRFEAPFFHADPHPGNVFVQPGSRILLLDFGACGMTSRRTRLYHSEVLRMAIDGDSDMVSRIMLADLSPLPQLDMDRLRRFMAEGFEGVIEAMDDKDAPWPDRMISGLWIKVMEIAREYNIRINLDTVRSIRAYLLYDTLVFRLDNHMSDKPLQDFLRDRSVRQRKVMVRRNAHLDSEDLRAMERARREEAMARVEYLLTKATIGADSLLLSFRLALGNLARAARVVARVLRLVSVVAVLLLALRLAGLDLVPWVRVVLHSTPTLLVLGLLILIGLRKGLYALERVQVGD